MSDAALNVADPFWLRRFNTGLEAFLDNAVPELHKSAGFSGTKMKAGRCRRSWGRRGGKSFP
jgi:hypothetical protein